MEHPMTGSTFYDKTFHQLKVQITKETKCFSYILLSSMTIKHGNTCWKEMRA
jgi:hypothetical protein